MELRVGGDGRTQLVAPDDFGAFKVVLDPALRSSAAALESAGAVKVQQHAWIGVGRVRALAGPAATQDWEQGFARMLAYAREHGFYDGDLDAIRAHCEYAAG